jgi:glycosyltransferase involved in cell wall biosynthesis
MAADCIVITVEHEYSAGSEIVADAGFVVQPTTKQLSRTISRALVGDVPDRLPVERAADFDWDVVTAQAESFYDSIV